MVIGLELLSVNNNHCLQIITIVTDLWSVKNMVLTEVLRSARWKEYSGGGHYVKVATGTLVRVNAECPPGYYSAYLVNLQINHYRNCVYIYCQH